MHSIYIENVCYNSNNFDEIYRWLLGRIISCGKNFTGRNGNTKWLHTFLDLDLSLEFPITRMRKLSFNKLVQEFFFDINPDSSNIENLGSARIFWENFADENGDLGASSYNRFFRRYPNILRGQLEYNEYLLDYNSLFIDQLKNVINELSKQPNSRRAVMFNGHPGFKYPSNGCKPCHPCIIFTPDGDGGLSITVTGRSNDAIFGTPLDIVRYSLLLYYVAYRVNMKPTRFLLPCPNTHIYEVNIEGAKEMAFSRLPVDILPQLDYDGNVFKLRNYNPHPSIKFQLAV